MALADILSLTLFKLRKRSDVMNANVMHQGLLAERNSLEVSVCAWPASST